MPFLIRFIFISIITTSPATTVAAPTVNVQADKASYSAGEQITISIALSDAPMIYGGGLDLTFNPAVVSANSVQVNPVWDFTIKEGIIDNATGVINDIFFTHFSGIEGDISVATIVLDTITAGSASISVTESLTKQFTDTGGENVVFTMNNLANSVLVSTTQEEADQMDEDQTTTDSSVTEQATTDQSENLQTTTDNSVFIPADRSSDSKEHSDTIKNTEQQGSEPYITNMQQSNAEIDSYNNRENSSTKISGTYPKNNYSENNNKEGTYHPTTQTQSTTTTKDNPTPNTDRNKTDNDPRLLITFAFLILAFIGYRLFVSRKK